MNWCLLYSVKAARWHCGQCCRDIRPRPRKREKVPSPFRGGREREPLCSSRKVFSLQLVSSWISCQWTSEGAAPWMGGFFQKARSRSRSSLGFRGSASTLWAAPWVKNNLLSFTEIQLIQNIERSTTFQTSNWRNSALPHLCIYPLLKSLHFSGFIWSFAFGLARSRCESWKTCWSIDSRVTSWEAACLEEAAATFSN